MQWAGFVRNVMLGREGLHRDVLLTIARDAGAEDVLSHLTTGNLTFTAEPERALKVAGRIASGVERVIGRPEPVILRDLEWLRELVAAEPFSGFDPAEWELEMAMVSLDAPPLAPTSLPDTGRTVLLAVLDRELLTARPRDGGNRPHVNQLLELASGLRATARGWSTLQRLATVR
jgi:uncharacterized protein (DUF1697 family)